MKRIRCGAAIAALFLLLFSACSGGKTVSLDPGATCTELLGSGAFSEGLEPLDTDLALSLYGLKEDECTDCLFYLSTGATAEELSILHARDRETVQVLQAAAELRLTSQKDSFENYIPGEMPKLERAIIRSKGDYLIYCVAADSETAEKIISKYFD